MVFGLSLFSYFDYAIGTVAAVLGGVQAGYAAETLAVGAGAVYVVFLCVFVVAFGHVLKVALRLRIKDGAIGPQAARAGIAAQGFGWGKAGGAMGCEANEVEVAVGT